MFVHGYQDVLHQQHLIWRYLQGPDPRAERRNLDILGADPIYVSPEVQQIVEAAAATFEPEPFVSTDLFTESGFMVLPSAIDGVHGFWWKTENGVDGETGGLITLKRRPDDEPEGVPGRRLSFASSHLIPFWAPDGDPLPEMRKKLTTYEELSGERDESLHAALNESAALARQRELPLRLWKFFQVCLRLAQQPLTTVENERLPRAMRRDLARRGEEREVTCIRLRRRVRGPSDGHQDVAWSHRWIVRGHWRSQWYPSLGLHRQIWISDHLKGPDDAELRITKRAFEVVR